MKIEFLDLRMHFCIAEVAQATASSDFKPCGPSSGGLNILQVVQKLFNCIIHNSYPLVALILNP